MNIDYDEIIEIIAGKTRLELTEEQVYEILDRDEELKTDVEIYGISDTDERERFLEELAKWLIGRGWPINGEPDPDFFQDLMEAAEARGLTILK